ncbi:MAG: protein kinase domain-containing protein [Kofleriaceae bacterium]
MDANSTRTSGTSSRYNVLAKWASGGMADIYVARQQGAGGFDKLVALKVLRDHGDATDFREMFLDEVTTAALLNHPAIVQTFDAGEIDDRLYMAMEFINGETLGRFHRSVVRREKSFHVELAIYVVREIASALAYAHELTTINGQPLQLVHRDVSPSNVLLSFEGTVKLLDFGIARVATKLHPTKAGYIKGKFAYMSPEQAAAKPIDHRADIYSLGIVLWQLLVGRQAFDADNDAELTKLVLDPVLEPPSHVNKSCTPALDEVVMKALAPDPDKRYSSAGAFARDLASQLGLIAPGFDGQGAIRAVMAEHFAERKQRLARIVSGIPENAMSIEEIDMLGGTIKTPSPHLLFPPTHDPELEIVVAPGPKAPLPKTRRLAGLIVLAGLAIAGAVGWFAYRGFGAQEPTPSPSSIASTPSSMPTTMATPTPAPSSMSTPTPTPSSIPAPSSMPTPTPTSSSMPAPSSMPTPTPTPTPAPPTTTTTTTTPTPTTTTTPTPTIARRKPTPAAPTPPKTTRTSTALATQPAPVSIDVAPTPKPTPTPTPRPTPAPTPTPKPAPGSLDAVPSLASVSVEGPLPDSEIRSTVERVLGMYRNCYRTAARLAGKTPALRVKLLFTIDEGRAARNLRVVGDPLGIASCLKDNASKLRTRIAPDVGTADVSVVVKFQPTEVP